MPKKISKKAPEIGKELACAYGNHPPEDEFREVQQLADQILASDTSLADHVPDQGVRMFLKHLKRKLDIISIKVADLETSMKDADDMISDLNDFKDVVEPLLYAESALEVKENLSKDQPKEVVIWSTNKDGSLTKRVEDLEGNMKYECILPSSNISSTTETHKDAIDAQVIDPLFPDNEDDKKKQAVANHSRIPYYEGDEYLSSYDRCSGYERSAYSQMCQCCIFCRMEHNKNNKTLYKCLHPTSKWYKKCVKALNRCSLYKYQSTSIRAYNPSPPVPAFPKVEYMGVDFNTNEEEVIGEN